MAFFDSLENSSHPMLKDYPQAKIIAMSGGGRTGTMNCLEVARAFGAQQVLEKPFPHQEILEAIRAVLGE